MVILYVVLKGFLVVVSIGSTSYEARRGGGRIMNYTSITVDGTKGADDRHGN